MARKNYKIDEVLRSLAKKNDCRIVPPNIAIMTGSSAKNDLGNGSWGKIDFLVNHCGFRTIHVTKW